MGVRASITALVMARSHGNASTAAKTAIATNAATSKGSTQGRVACTRPTVIGRRYLTSRLRVERCQAHDVDLEVVDREVLDAAAELPAVGLVHRRREGGAEAPVSQ